MATREPPPDRFVAPPAPERFYVPVDVPAAFAGHDFADDLEHLTPIVLALLAAGVSRRTIERRLTRDWPAQGEPTP